MKTKLDAAEKARRQEWRDKRYAQPSTYTTHHLTRTERNTLKEEQEKVLPRKPLLSVSAFYKMFLAMTALTLPVTKETANT
jgi:hypothetical protein